VQIYCFHNSRQIIPRTTKPVPLESFNPKAFPKMQHNEWQRAICYEWDRL